MRFRPENIKNSEEEKKQEVKEYGSRKKGFERDNILALLSRVKNKKKSEKGERIRCSNRIAIHNRLPCG